MSEKNSQANPARVRAGEKEVEGGRRRFLLLIPCVVFGSIASTVAAAAYRFLRPQAPDTRDGGDANWVTLAPLSELKGDEPLMRTVAVEHAAGWTQTRAERVVYVLPREQNRVVSAVCPHEGCEVTWRNAERDFFCPCHDSRFSPEGARLEGPARSDLATLPARVRDGALQIQNQPSSPVAEESGAAVRG